MTSSCLMSPEVCGLSSVCARTSTRRLLDATLRAAAAVAAVSGTNSSSSIIASSSAVRTPPPVSIGCCSSEVSMCVGAISRNTDCGRGGGGGGVGGGGICGNSVDDIGDEVNDNCAAVAVASAVALATDANSNTSSSSSSSSTFKCPRCPRAYALSYTLERHMKYECGVAKQFGCFNCGKRFSRKDILKAHISNRRRHCAIALAEMAAGSAIVTAPSSSTAGGGDGVVSTETSKEDSICLDSLESQS